MYGVSAHDIGDTIPQHSLDISKVVGSAVRSCAEDAHMAQRIDHASVAAKKQSAKEVIVLRHGVSLYVSTTHDI